MKTPFGIPSLSPFAGAAGGVGQDPNPDLFVAGDSSTSNLDIAVAGASSTANADIILGGAS